MLLLLAGLAGTLGGAAALAYGFVSPGFRSDAIVVAAVLGIAGGLILVALAAIAGQLRRIAEALEAQPMARGVATIAEPRTSEAAAAGASAVAAALALDAEPPPSSPPTPPTSGAPALEPVPTARSSPEIPMPLPANLVRAADRLPPAAPMPPPAAPPSLSAPSTPLSAEWPHGEASTRGGGPRGGASAPSRDHAARALLEPLPPPTSRPAPPVLERSGPAALERSAPPPERSAPPVEAPPGEKPRVLKSGVIEGMAYTLYADGSVDAELPTGTTHFASISAWRAHLREGV
jgi:hypothetical protein